MESGSAEQLITVHIKTPKNKETVQTAPNATVKQFKELVSQKFNAQPDKICLIFSGKILKDDETLDKLDIKDGLTVRSCSYDYCIASCNCCSYETLLVRIPNHTLKSTSNRFKN